MSYASKKTLQVIKMLTDGGSAPLIRSVEELNTVTREAITFKEAVKLGANALLCVSFVTTSVLEDVSVETAANLNIDLVYADLLKTVESGSEEEKQLKNRIKATKSRVKTVASYILKNAGENLFQGMEEQDLITYVLVQVSKGGYHRIYKQETQAKADRNAAAQESKKIDAASRSKNTEVTAVTEDESLDEDQKALLLSFTVTEAIKTLQSMSSNKLAKAQLIEINKLISGIEHAKAA